MWLYVVGEGMPQQCMQILHCLRCFTKRIILVDFLDLLSNTTIAEYMQTQNYWLLFLRGYKDVFGQTCFCI